MRSFRVSRTKTPPTRRDWIYAEFAAWAVLLAAALVIVGAYGAAVVVTAAAIALGVASHIEKREQNHAG